MVQLSRHGLLSHPLLRIPFVLFWQRLNCCSIPGAGMRVQLLLCLPWLYLVKALAAMTEVTWLLSLDANDVTSPAPHYAARAAPPSCRRAWWSTRRPAGTSAPATTSSPGRPRLPAAPDSPETL